MSKEAFFEILADAMRSSEAFQPHLTIWKEGCPKWEDVEIRVKSKCVGKYESRLKLALAWAKYDLNGAPSNWETEFKHEDLIPEILDWIEAKKDKYAWKIKKSIEMFEKGMIPDCSWILFEFPGFQ
jgi:hypothetical protein